MIIQDVKQTLGRWWRNSWDPRGPSFRANHLGWILHIKPWYLLLFAFGIGVVLSCLSWLIGVNKFIVNVEFVLEDNSIVPRTLAAGFNIEPQYGPWYVLPF